VDGSIFLDLADVAKAFLQPNEEKGEQKHGE